MTEWTEGANEEWDAYARRVRASLASMEEDADEVLADLRCHVEEELANVDMVTAEQMRRVTQGLGFAGNSETAVEEERAESRKSEKRATQPTLACPAFTAIGLGVVLPSLSNLGGTPNRDVRPAWRLSHSDLEARPSGDVGAAHERLGVHCL